MGAADEIRSGIRAKYAALEEAGLNTHTVELFIFKSKSGANEIAGKQGERRYDRLILKPNPEITMRRREIMTENGFVTTSDVSLKGAFPDQLSGLDIVTNEAGQTTASSPIVRTFATPREFRAAIERTDYILIDGERYQFRAGGTLDSNETESEWTMKLLRSEKQ